MYISCSHHKPLLDNGQIKQSEIDTFIHLALNSGYIEKKEKVQIIINLY